MTVDSHEPSADRKLASEHNNNYNTPFPPYQLPYAYRSPTPFKHALGGKLIYPPNRVISTGTSKKSSTSLASQTPPSAFTQDTKSIETPDYVHVISSNFAPYGSLNLRKRSHLTRFGPVNDELKSYARDFHYGYEAMESKDSITKQIDIISNECSMDATHQQRDSYVDSMIDEDSVSQDNTACSVLSNQIPTIPDNLLRQIISDDSKTRSMKYISSEPLGNTLSHVRDSSTGCSFLLHVSGPIMNVLNVTPVQFTTIPEMGRIKLRPITFSFPILQITTNYLQEFDQHSPYTYDIYIAVRTTYSISILQFLGQFEPLKMIWTRQFPVMLTHVEWNTNHTLLRNNNLHFLSIMTDTVRCMIWSSSKRDLITQLSNDSRLTIDLKKALSNAPVRNNSLKKCVFGSFPQSVLVTCDGRSVHFADFRRDETRFDELTRLSGPTERICAFGRDPLQPFEYVLCTDKLVQLYDQRMSNRALLQWEHKLQNDPPNELVFASVKGTDPCFQSKDNITDRSDIKLLFTYNHLTKNVVMFPYKSSHLIKMDVPQDAYHVYRTANFIFPEWNGEDLTHPYKMQQAVGYGSAVHLNSFSDSSFLVSPSHYHSSSKKRLMNGFCVIPSEQEHKVRVSHEHMIPTYLKLFHASEVGDVFVQCVEPEIRKPYSWNEENVADAKSYENTEQTLMPHSHSVKNDYTLHCGDNNALNQFMKWIRVTRSRSFSSSIATENKLSALNNDEDEDPALIFQTTSTYQPELNLCLGLMSSRNNLTCNRDKFYRDYFVLDAYKLGKVATNMDYASSIRSGMRAGGHDEALLHDEVQDLCACCGSIVVAPAKYRYGSFAKEYEQLFPESESADNDVVCARCYMKCYRYRKQKQNQLSSDHDESENEEDSHGKKKKKKRKEKKKKKLKLKFDQVLLLSSWIKSNAPCSLEDIYGYMISNKDLLKKKKDGITLKQLFKFLSKLETKHLDRGIQLVHWTSTMKHIDADDPSTHMYDVYFNYADSNLIHEIRSVWGRTQDSVARQQVSDDNFHTTTDLNSNSQQSQIIRQSSQSSQESQPIDLFNTQSSQSSLPAFSSQPTSQNADDILAALFSDSFSDEISAPNSTSAPYSSQQTTMTESTPISSIAPIEPVRASQSNQYVAAQSDVPTTQSSQPNPLLSFFESSNLHDEPHPGEITDTAAEELLTALFGDELPSQQPSISQPQSEPTQQQTSNDPLEPLFSASDDASTILGKLFNIRETTIDEVVATLVPEIQEQNQLQMEKQITEAVEKVLLEKLKTMSIAPRMKVQLSQRVASGGFRKYFSNLLRANDLFGQLSMNNASDLDRPGTQYSMSFEDIIHNNSAETNGTTAAVQESSDADAETEDLHYFGRIRQRCQEIWAKWDNSNQSVQTFTETVKQRQDDMNAQKKKRVEDSEEEEENEQHSKFRKSRSKSSKRSSSQSNDPQQVHFIIPDSQNTYSDSLSYLNATPSVNEDPDIMINDITSTLFGDMMDLDYEQPRTHSQSSEVSSQQPSQSSISVPITPQTGEPTGASDILSTLFGG